MIVDSNKIRCEFFQSHKFVVDFEYSIEYGYIIFYQDF